MSLSGKGYFIWKIPDCERGDIQAIANLAVQAGFSHVLIKIADRAISYNVTSSGVDLVPPLAQALRARGIQVWGWHYIYGDDPIGEANKAIQRLQQTQADGYVLDVEHEYKEPGKSSAASKFMSRMRAEFPSLPMALSSYRYPSYHPQVPWEAFLDGCTYNMPQVYWEQAHNPADQLVRSVREFQAMTPYRPVIPTGSAYTARRWSPTSADINAFLQAARSLNLGAANFWEWSNTRAFLPELWETIREFNWSASPVPQDIVKDYIAALNAHNPDRVAGLYTASALHVNMARTIHGLPAIRTWYQSFFNQILPNARFTLTGFSGAGNSRHFTWTAVSPKGIVRNGNDTLALIGEKIAYHYTNFTVS